jgi:hypothetical protein
MCDNSSNDASIAAAAVVISLIATTGDATSAGSADNDTSTWISNIAGVATAPATCQLYLLTAPQLPLLPVLHLLKVS